MKIYIKSADGEMVEAFKVDEHTYTFKTENKIFELSLSESKNVHGLRSISDKRKKDITKEIFSNDDIIEQLRDAKDNRDSDFSYYSGDELEFD